MVAVCPWLEMAVPRTRCQIPLGTLRGGNRELRNPTKRHAPYLRAIAGDQAGGQRAARRFPWKTVQKHDVVRRPARSAPNGCHERPSQFIRAVAVRIQSKTVLFVTNLELPGHHLIDYSAHCRRAYRSTAG